MQQHQQIHNKPNETMMPENKPILLIGPISPPQWGPAVRNRIMLDTFRDWNIDVLPINTLEWKRKPLGFLWSVIKNTWQSRLVILSVSRNGRFLLIPLLFCISLFHRIRIAFIPAGGTFAHDLDALNTLGRWLYICIMKRFDIICVQRAELANQLKLLGVANPVVLPNFKVAPQMLPTRPIRDISSIVFLSRIRELKGIEPLLDALDLLAKQGVVFTIEFFGIVTADYQEKFDFMLKDRSYARYGGVLEYDHVIETISTYDLMVFPSVCLTEGFPGVLADAALAGLPVVASNVPSNLEIIKDGNNGLLAKAGNATDLAEKIGLVLHDSKLRETLARNNRAKGLDYDVNVVLKSFIKELHNMGWQI
jgi:glycosyltransferase involved in cell wall biosynthesis